MAQIGREVFDSFPGWVRVSFYSLAAIAILAAGAAPWVASALGLPSAPFDQAVGAMAALAGAGALLSDLGGARRRGGGSGRP